MFSVFRKFARLPSTFSGLLPKLRDRKLPMNRRDRESFTPFFQEQHNWRTNGLKRVQVRDTSLLSNTSPEQTVSSAKYLFSNISCRYLLQSHVSYFILCSNRLGCGHNLSFDIQGSPSSLSRRHCRSE